MSDRKYSARLICSQETKNLITIECVDEYLKHHPEMKGKKISQNHILTQIGNFYRDSIW